MKIKNLFGKGRPVFSFEFFPPKTEEAEGQLFGAIEKLRPLKPTFISVTCGAMGTTKTKTAELAALIKEKLGAESMAHLTCVANDRAEILTVLNELKARGIENVLALRGDPPKENAAFKRPENGFGYAVELIRFIRENFGNDFSLGTAGYPEKHIECATAELDLDHLREKVRAGADFVITQLFFINDNFFRFVDRARKVGIRVPIVPGIMPVTNVGQISIFEKMCGVQIPAQLREDLTKIGEDKEGIERYGVEYATKQCEELLAAGVEGIHFYTLNRSKATKEIFKNLNLTSHYLTHTED